MKIYSIYIKIIDKVKYIRTKMILIKRINEKRRKNNRKKIKFTSIQKKSINEFYKKYYGKKIPLKWHKEYYFVSDKFDYKYIPETIALLEFEKQMNNPNYYKCFSDKNVIEKFFEKTNIAKIPKAFFRCSNGIITNFDGSIITFDCLIDELNNIGEVFIKPALYCESGGGKKCQKLNLLNGIDRNSKRNINEIINEYKDNYVIQEVLKNNTLLNKIHPQSFNTFRIITYFLDGKVYHAPIVLKMGIDDLKVDNIGAGGIFVGVKDDGTFCEAAKNEFGDTFLTHPNTNVRFSECKCENIKKVIEAAHKMQAMLPQIGCIHWDFSIDENEDVVFLEANVRYGGFWLPQMAHGEGVFGENTEKILLSLR